MDAKILFIDTNGFIQLRDLKDLEWRKLFPSVKHIRLMVARPVIEELDKHKTSTNDRRRDRARLALRLIAEASKAPKRTLALRQKPVAVTLEIAPRAKLDWDSLGGLDPNSSDDRLVAAAYTFGNDAAVFSHDTGPRITAHDIGLEAHEPPEDWHLPAEKSDEQRRISVLERQLKVAQSTKPQLQIEFENQCEPPDKLTLFRPIVPPLDEKALEQMVQSYIAAHPRGSPKAVHYMLAAAGQGLSQSDVDGYHDRYDTFEERVRTFFEGLHEQLPYWLAVPTLGVAVKNIGSVSATNFHVTLETSDGLTLAAEVNDIRDACPFPRPPEVPSEYDKYRIPNLGIGTAHVNPPHPTEVVWIKRPKIGGKLGRYGCDDFQPERTDNHEVALWHSDPLPVTGKLRVTAGANNVPDITKSIEITIQDREDTWDSLLVMESLPDFLRTASSKR